MNEMAFWDKNVVNAAFEATRLESRSCADKNIQILHNNVDEIVGN